MAKLCGNALRAFVAAFIVGLLALSGASAQSGNPIKIGVSLALTGAGAAPSKVDQHRAGTSGATTSTPRADCWAARSSSSSTTIRARRRTCPAIYTKLITVDKVDLLLGPYGTNFVAPAMPTIIQNKKLTISFTAIGINDKFNYDKYFSMVSVGPEGVNSFSIGFFDMAAAQKPKPETVAILAADAEFAQGAAQGAREEIKKHGFKLVYDKSYPPSTTDFAPVVRAVQATNPDIVYIGAYPPDNVGIIRAANEIGLSPKMMGGAMIGMLVTPIKVQLGPLANGLITGENYAAATGTKHPGRPGIPQALFGEGRGGRRRPAGLRLGTVRLWRRPGAGAGGDRDQEPRPRQARRIHAQGELQDRGRQISPSQRTENGRRRAWTGRRSRTPSRTTSISSVTARRSRSCGRPRPRPDTLIYPYADARKK